MTNKEIFLKENVGFHYEDLSLMRQIELQQIIKEMGVSVDWMLLALSKDTLENWEKWGFALFKKADFRTTINNLEQVINSMSEDKFKKENNRKNQKNPQIWVSEETFRRIWNSVKQQGQLYTEEEAAAHSIPCYWTYNPTLEPERRSNVDMMVACSELPEEDWTAFVVSVRRVEAAAASL